MASRGMDAGEGEALIAELMAWCTQEHYVYTHAYEVGDVLIWDERATLHRGCPWPYEEPRTLDSILRQRIGKRRPVGRAP